MEGPISHSPQMIDFIQWVFYALLLGIGSQVVVKMGKMTESIDGLNLKMAQILERVSWHEREIGRLDERVEKLEVKS